MHTVGIICEYNPIHMGHIYHIEETKRALGEDTCVICCMSGEFVQRGEPAIFSKSARARAAVAAGADVVIQLPVYASLSSAENFALQGVMLLEAAGVCSHISFGSECGDIKALGDIAEAMGGLDIKEELDKGLSYAAAVQASAEKAGIKNAELIKSPNNLLAIEYIKALKKINSSMIPVTVKRTGGDHDGAYGYSASAIRNSMAAGVFDFSNIPDAAAEIFKEEIKAGRGPVFLENYEDALFYRLATMTEADYENVAGGGEGLGRRLMKAAREETGTDNLLAKIKTKRYPMTRIRRMLMCAYLGITEREAGKNPEYIRILAASAKGRELLGRMKREAALPVVTKPASGLEFESGVRQAHFTDLYMLGMPDKTKRTKGTDLTVSPFIEK